MSPSESVGSDTVIVSRRNQSPLAVRAAEEYGYVSRDVRRILRVGGLMVAALGVFVVLIDILRVIKV